MSNNLTQFTKNKKSLSVLDTPKESKVVQIGRPPKEQEEKCIHKAQLNFTESEWNQLKEKAGYTPIGTFLKAMLKEQKVFK
jgi:hypothetical protein